MARTTARTAHSLSSVYVAAASPRTIALLNSLIGSDYELRTLTDTPLKSVRLSQAVRAAIDAPRLVIGLLAGDDSDAEVLVELGVAASLGKPIVILSEGDVSVPALLREAIHVSVSG